MISKKYPFILIFLLSATEMNAQSGTVSSGGDLSGTTGSLSYSVGQVDDRTLYSSSNGMALEGLQVPYEIFILEGMEDHNILLEASIYPNPTTDRLYLKFPSIPRDGYTMLLYDMSGKVLKEESIRQTQTEIEMERYAKGTYLLKVILNGKDQKTFKIVKH